MNARVWAATCSGGLLLWPAKALLFTGFLLLLLQGISEIVKKIAVMRGLIPDYNAPSGHHAPPDLDPDLLKQAGFADPDHPLTDLPVDTSPKGTRK